MRLARFLSLGFDVLVVSLLCDRQFLGDRVDSKLGFFRFFGRFNRGHCLVHLTLSFFGLVVNGLKCGLLGQST